MSLQVMTFQIYGIYIKFYMINAVGCSINTIYCTSEHLLYNGFFMIKQFWSNGNINILYDLKSQHGIYRLLFPMAPLHPS